MDKYEKVKDKLICLDQIWMRVEELMKKQRISQVDMVRLCQRKGYSIQQPEISKLKSGKCKITLYQLMAFADVLEVGTDYLINGSVNENTVVFPLNNRFITNADDEDFKGILGEYYTLFHSTGEMEDKWLKGKLSLNRSSEGICRAEFVLWTGEKNHTEQNVAKKYQGQVIISKKQKSMYCILINNMISEMCFIAFRFRPFQTIDMACRIGLVLTFSSGEDRTPVVHKMFLSRKKIDKEMHNAIAPTLQLTNKDSLISRKKLQNLRCTYPEWQDEIDKILQQQPEEYYMLYESMQGILKLNMKEKLRMKGLIKECADMSYVVSLTKEDDDGAFLIQQEEN